MSARPASAAAPLLSVAAVDAGYGEAQVLFGASLAVAAGEVVAVVGANGAGKTTLLSTVAGLVRARSGTVLFKGEDITRAAPHRLVAEGLALVPEGGRLFPFMTVQENLELGAYAPASRRVLRERLDEAMATFPVLGERRSQLAGRLSGGERQMCAIARALMSRPTLLMLDEPSVGLSPLMVERVFDIVGGLARGGGLTVVLVEQHVGEALDLADRAYVIDHGRIVRDGAASALRHDRDIQATYMGL